MPSDSLKNSVCGYMCKSRVVVAAAACRKATECLLFLQSESSCCSD